MPEVTVWPSRTGLPIATTKSPTSALSESASGNVHEVVGLDLEHGDVGARIVADDLGRERAVVRAACTVISSAFSTTCAFVMM